MKRRQFLQGSAVAAASIGFADLGAAVEPRRFLLQNPQLAWHLEESDQGIRSTAFENRITGRSYKLRTENEFALVFSQGQRIEIPWWHFQLTDGGNVPPDREHGFTKGFHTLVSAATEWKPVRNLAGGQNGRAYTGYGWFRQVFTLPKEANGRDFVFVLGGYDEQDWNEHWVYMNGEEIGHRAVTGRWRRPGRYIIHPGDTAYATLQFGPQSRNVLAVRARGYDFHSEGLSEEALEQ